MVSFDPVAAHNILSKFRSRIMFQNATGLFNQMVGRFSIWKRRKEKDIWKKLHKQTEQKRKTDKKDAVYKPQANDFQILSNQSNDILIRFR